MKYVVENSKKLYEKIREKINKSKVYNTYNKLFPYAFFCSSLLALPSIYLLKNKLK